MRYDAASQNWFYLYVWCWSIETPQDLGRIPLSYSQASHWSMAEMLASDWLTTAPWPPGAGTRESSFDHEFHFCDNINTDHLESRPLSLLPSPPSWKVTHDASANNESKENFCLVHYKQHLASNVGAFWLFSYLETTSCFPRSFHVLIIKVLIRMYYVPTICTSYR